MLPVTKNVRNNREYDAITKEMELIDLETQIAQKKIKELAVDIENKNEVLNETQERKLDREKDLEVKKKELDQLIAETEADEKKLQNDRKRATKHIEARLLRSYDKIRSGAKNGLAVVNVQREACGGCFNIVPPQRQADIKDQKKIIVCEHCGRILADVEDVIVEEKPKRKTTRKKTTKKKEEEEA